MKGYICILLPFPPSVWALYRRDRHITKRYRAWQAEAYAALLEQPKQPTLDGPVHLKIGLGRPDRRRRDASNYIKAPEDFLVKFAKLIPDDHLCEHVEAFWADDVVNGCRIEVEAA